MNEDTQKMEKKEEKGFFGWFFTNREMVIVQAMKYLFLLGISLIYLAGVITVYDILFKWLMTNTAGIDFAWKAVIFGLGLAVIVFAVTLLIYLLIVAYYFKFFEWFEKRLEWIDPSKQIGDK